MRFSIILFAVLLLINGIFEGPCFSQTIKVRIFSTTNTAKVFIGITEGAYLLKADRNIVSTFRPGDLIQIETIGDSLQIKSFEKNIGVFHGLTLVPSNVNGEVSIKVLEGNAKIRLVTGGLNVSVDNHGLKLINVLDIENYIAGVVSSEVGRDKNLEYYKLQSIICRTYCLANWRKHEADSFNLCDQVHCQAFYGKSTTNSINLGVKLTAGKVIVDDNLNLISAAFHSNCGGTTINSEDVWTLSASYLRGKKDTFCLKMPNANWTKTIGLNLMLNYLNSNLKEKKIDSIDLVHHLPFNNDMVRSLNFSVNEFNFPLKNIRSDFKLRSTLFKIFKYGDSLIFQGKGYGHGVGLCQEGAIRMSQLGYNFKDIMDYYYTNVHLVDLGLLSYFRED